MWYGSNISDNGSKKIEIAFTMKLRAAECLLPFSLGATV
jgi:hypothetical protein